MRNKKKGPAQQYLERIESLETQIDRKRDKMERLYCLATKCTSSMSASGAAGGGNRDKMAPSDASLDLEKEIDQDKEKLKAMISEACDLLARVPGKAHYDVLYKHYIEYKSFEQVAVEMGYTYRNAHYLHGRALQAFEKVLEEYNRYERHVKEAQDILKKLSPGKIELNIRAADLRAIAQPLQVSDTGGIYQAAKDEK